MSFTRARLFFSLTISSPFQAEKEANKLKARGIHVIVVGMGNHIDPADLSVLGNNPDKDFFHFKDLESMVERTYEVALRACEPV